MLSMYVLNSRHQAIGFFGFDEFFHRLNGTFGPLEFIQSAPSPVTHDMSIIP